MGKGIGGHQSAAMKNDEWLTPPEIINALGAFDLDPCSQEIRPWPTAAKHYTKADDGLAMPWFGRVWCNPPYGSSTGAWLSKLSHHGNGIALVFARTETDMFFKWVWGKADAVLFLRGRLYFYHADGSKARHNAGGPSCLVAYGADNVTALERSGLAGRLIVNP